MSGLTRCQYSDILGGMNTDTNMRYPSNAQVADDLGMSISGVSRLRSGARLPSLQVMVKIEQAYGWTVQDQTAARMADSSTWDEHFAAELNRFYQGTLF